MMVGQMMATLGMARYAEAIADWVAGNGLHVRGTPEGRMLPNARANEIAS